MLRSLRDERLGLVLIASSLLVILVTSGLLLASHRDSQRAQNRAQGISLVRLLSRIPIERLIPRDGHQGPLEVMRTSQNNPFFAYGTIVGLYGEPLAEVTSAGVIVPPAPIADDPASWVGERVVASTETGRSVREFFAPVLVEGERVAHVRIGFFEPGVGISLEHASLLGMVALPIFLLAPLAYFLLRREVRPVADACDQINRLTDGQQFGQVQLEASGQVGEFIHSFNRFVLLVENRVRDVEARQLGVVASSKVLSYQKSRIEAVLETLPDAMLVLDETGAVTFANARLEAILGVPAETALGQKPEAWCENREVVSFLARFQGASTRMRRSDAIEFSPGGAEEKVLEVSAHPLDRADDKPAVSGTLVLVRDVTAAALARRAQVEFVTHVAHELKAPLNVMAMYTETLLEKDGQADDFRIEACNVLQDEVERLSMLVSTLLSIARIETGAVSLDRQRTRLADLLRDAFETVSRGARGTDLKFVLDLPGELSPIHVDKELLRVSVNNLLTNAIKYNREGGEVTLSADETADEISIQVRDTGIGIRDEDKSRVFGKFFRSDAKEVRERVGHGLGLALASEIVELHGGRIELESTPGEGSQFSIVFKKTPALVKEAA